MDKKKQMLFNLNNFLLATSIAMDFKENYLHKISLNHSKRVAFIALNLGIKYNLEAKEMADLCAYSLCYNIGNENIKKIPFLNGLETIENPLFLEIISFASSLDKKFFLGIDNIEKRVELINFIKENTGVLFSETLVNNFLDISKQVSFWLDLQSENDILMFIYANLHDFTIELNFEEILKITATFHKMLNTKSIFIELCEKILDDYNFEHKDKYTFLIAASLQNIGKLTIPSIIVNKKDELTLNEYEQIKAYPYYTKKILNNIMGFTEISNWASKVQERLDGSGYPYGFIAKDLSLKDRLMNTLNIYNALIEDRKYRSAYTHLEAIEIMRKEAEHGKMDISLVNDFDRIFK